jgi:hypothetical protein
MEVHKRHSFMYTYLRVNNFIGWVFMCTIVGIPVGSMMIIAGHTVLTLIEIEENTRRNALATERLANNSE